jgi:hypothetical protein
MIDCIKILCRTGKFSTRAPSGTRRFNVTDGVANPVRHIFFSNQLFVLNLMALVQSSALYFHRKIYSNKKKTSTSSRLFLWCCKSCRVRPTHHDAKKDNTHQFNIDRVLCNNYTKYKLIPDQKFFNKLAIIGFLGFYFKNYPV